MIKMTAVKLGFYKGAMVRPGTHFDFDDSRMQVPQWAVPFGTPVPDKVPNLGQCPEVTMEELRENAERRAKADALLVDTKPLEAQLASHHKAGTRPSDPVDTYGFL